MKEIKFENEAVYQAEDVTPLQETDLKKIIVSKENFENFLIKYIVETGEKLLRVNLKCVYGAFKRGLCNKKSVKLEDELKIEETFYVIKNKINKVKGTDNMFVPYGKIRIEPFEQPKVNLRIMSCFANRDIYLRKVIIRSKNIYFVHANVNKAKILSI